MTEEEEQGEEEQEEELCILAVGLYHQRAPGSPTLSSNFETGFYPHPGPVSYYIKTSVS